MGAVAYSANTPEHGTILLVILVPETGICLVRCESRANVRSFADPDQPALLKSTMSPLSHLLETILRMLRLLTPGKRVLGEW